MKWMMIIVVMGTGPVKTELTYDSLQDCLNAEDKTRQEISDAYNRWQSWAAQNPEQSGYPSSETFMRMRLGMGNRATCIPYSNK